MLDSIKVIGAIANQNIPQFCNDNFFSGLFEAKYDNVVIKYEEKGYQRSLNFSNVVIKTRLSTSVSYETGIINTQMHISMTSNGRRVFDERLNRPEYVQEFGFITKQISNTYKSQDSNRNLKLWEIVDKF